MPEKKLKLFDVIIIAAFLLLIFLAFLPRFAVGDGELYLSVISDSGESIYSLSENREIELISRNINVRIVINNNEAYIEYSECPGGICMRADAAKIKGDTVICAPAGVALSVKAGGGTDADAFAG